MPKTDAFGVLIIDDDNTTPIRAWPFLDWGRSIHHSFSSAGKTQPPERHWSLMVRTLLFPWS